MNLTYHLASKFYCTFSTLVKTKTIFFQFHFQWKLIWVLKSRDNLKIQIKFIISLKAASLECRLLEKFSFFLYTLLAAVNEFKKSSGKTSIGVSLHRYSSLVNANFCIVNLKPKNFMLLMFTLRSVCNP